MTARAKARALKLRRAPDAEFAAEAMRRGFVRQNGRAMMSLEQLETFTNKLGEVVVSLVDGGDLFFCVRATRQVEKQLREYLAAYGPRGGAT